MGSVYKSNTFSAYNNFPATYFWPSEPETTYPSLYFPKKGEKGLNLPELVFGKTPGTFGVSAALDTPNYI